MNLKDNIMKMLKSTDIKNIELGELLAYQHNIDIWDYWRNAVRIARIIKPLTITLKTPTEECLLYMNTLNVLDFSEFYLRSRPLLQSGLRAELNFKKDMLFIKNECHNLKYVIKTYFLDKEENIIVSEIFKNQLTNEPKR